MMIKDIVVPMMSSTLEEGCLLRRRVQQETFFSRKGGRLQCGHAVALSNYIHGTTYNNHADDNEIHWSTELDSEISCIASTHDGSVIAAATVDGYISLLRGTDGRILLSKSIGNACTTSSSSSSSSTCCIEETAVPKISFVENSKRDKHVLVIYNLDNHHRHGPKTGEDMNVLLLTNIHGSELNSNDFSTAKQSLAKLSLHGIILPHGDAAASHSNCIEMMKALFLSKRNRDVIRFVIFDPNNGGKVSVHDYVVESKEIHTVKECLWLDDVGPVKDISMDVISGGMTSKGPEQQGKDEEEGECFIVIMCSRHDEWFLEWYQWDSLQRVGHCCLNNYMDEGMVCCTVDAFCALVPWNDCTVAVAVAMRSQTIPCEQDGSRLDAPKDDDYELDCVVSLSQIVVLQGIVSSSMMPLSSQTGIANQGETNNHLAQRMIHGIHEVYSINVESGYNIIDLADCSIEKCRECAVRYCMVLRGKDGHVVDVKFREYHSGIKKNVIADAKLLLANSLFDEAQELVSSSSAKELSTPYGSIHVSDIVLARFKHMISKPQILTGQSKDQVKECLRRLSFGAVSGGSRGVNCLILASKAIYHLDPENNHASYRLSGPYIRDYRLTLLAMAMSISNALKGVSNKFVKSLKQEIILLEEKASVLKTIELTLGISSARNKVELTPPLLHVKNHKELYHLLIQKGAFLIAEDVRKSELGTKFISTIDMAESVSKISSDIDPRKYCSWIKDVVIPHLNIHQKIVVSIANWACKVADEFDQEFSFGIDSSILLLETVGSAMKKLIVDNHCSFANRSTIHLCDEHPEIEGLLMVECNNMSQSEYSNCAYLNNCEMDENLVRKEHSSASLEQTMDYQGAEKDTTFISILNIKLRNAKIIKKARNTGLPFTALKLSTFDYSEGPNFAAKELVRLFFTNSWSDYLSDHCNQKEKVKEFCRFIDMPFDHAIHLYAKDLCSLESVDPSLLAGAHDLVALCSKPEIKCDITLRFLQLAQLSSTKPKSLKALAKEALNWVYNEEVRSELQEASRLLGIDEILRKYCGNKASEFFRVSDPIHSIRLMNYITTKYPHPSVVSDVLYLCSAFTHLSALDNCSILLQRIIESLCSPSDVDRCITTLEAIYENDKELGDSVAARVCFFCANSMTSDFKVFTSKKSRQRQYEVTCVAAVEICRISCGRSSTGNESKLKKFLISDAGKLSWVDLLHEFRTLLELQKEFDLFISLHELRRRHKSDALATALVRDALKGLETTSDNVGRSLRIRLSKAKKGLSLLFHDLDTTVVTSKWCKAVGQVACNLVSADKGEMSILLLENAGVLDEIYNPTAYRAIIVVVQALCSKAANCNTLDGQRESAMKSLLLANSLMQEHALVFCPTVLLPYMIFLGNLIDVVTQIILRFDCGVGEQMESFKRNLMHTSKARLSPLKEIPDGYGKDTLRRNTANITLHPSWHCGDGLLLPPDETLSESMIYCKQILSPNLRQNNVVMLGIHKFLEDRGSYNISLRMLTNASVVTYCYHLDENMLHHQIEVLHGILLKLAERSLGGSGTGNINGKIDHEMAVPLLLTLRMKVAFKAFQRCLPSAISNRDYDRVIALANVGSRASGINCVDESYSKYLSHLTWRNQTTFSHQCQSLAKKAFWWRVLQKVGVKFSPSRFDDDERYQGKKIEYITSLLFEVVRMASQFLKDIMIMQSLITDFCTAFDLDHALAVQKHIEYLLSIPEKVNDDVQILVYGNMDARHNIETCCRGVQKLLLSLPNTVSRSTTLRNCLIAMEKMDNFGKNFERYAAVLSLYQKELRDTIHTQTNVSSLQRSFSRQELEAIDRRQDALVIINSIFEDKQLDERPSVHRCFFPLTDSSSKVEKEHPRKMIGVLGEHGNYGDDAFDPLLPLISCLKSDASQSTLSSLAPICFAIGIPSGYIHARALILRITATKQIGGSPPAFASEVLPVIKRLKSPKDGAELAEWCASQYDIHSKERFFCLEVGLDLAMKASTQAEQLLLASRQMDSRELIENEKSSLERVERISLAKSALSDCITVKSIMQNAILGNKDVTLSRITSTLVDKARSYQSQGPEITPEEFAENLLIVGSLICAEACLDTLMPLDSFGFYRIASAVHRACKGLEDQYSHIDISRIVGSLVRRYLLHGDEALIQPVEKCYDSFLKREVSSTSEYLDTSMDEDATMNLVLDLKIPPDRNVWGDDLGSEEPQLKRVKTMATTDEGSSINAVTTRENSEYLSRRVGLRVAFIMSFADEFYSYLREDSCSNDENMDPNTSTASEANLSEPLARKHAVYLLNIVFSKNSSLEKKNYDCSTINEETSISICDRGIQDRDNLTPSIRSSKSSTTLRGKYNEDRKALTFAMRHRALRAACALCPERLLQVIIAEEGYSEDMTQRETTERSKSPKNCMLSKYCFGTFVAKEIEAMGLALPHSDLIQLSAMHHPSYARTLWRNHGKSSNLGNQGRLMLLILELSLREKKVVDGDLVQMILEKVHSLNLPRTYLLACECLAQLPNEEQRRILSHETKIGALWLQLLHNVTMSILDDISTSMSVKPSHWGSLSRDHTLESSILTMQRWICISQSFWKNAICTTTSIRRNLLELQPLLFILSLALDAISECMSKDKDLEGITVDDAVPSTLTDSLMWELCQYILAIFETSMQEVMQMAPFITKIQNSCPMVFPENSSSRHSFNLTSKNLQVILNKIRTRQEEAERDASKAHNWSFKKAETIFYQKIMIATDLTRRMDEPIELSGFTKNDQLTESDCLIHLLHQDKTLYHEMWNRWSSSPLSSSD